MIWISIILGIIEAIPSIINLIKLIIAAIHGGSMSLGDRLYHEHVLQGILLDWHLSKDVAALETGLKGIASQLGVVVP